MFQKSIGFCNIIYLDFQFMWYSYKYINTHQLFDQMSQQALRSSNLTLIYLSSYVFKNAFDRPFLPPCFFKKIFALTSNLVSTYSLVKKQNTLYTLNFKCCNLCVEHFRLYLCYNLQFNFRFKKSIKNIFSSCLSQYKPF